MDGGGAEEGGAVTLFSTDHKVIGRQYIGLALFSVLLGLLLSLVMRFHLAQPDARVKWMQSLWPDGAPGGQMTPELYLALLTMHGTLMVFFVLSTAPQAGFGNYFLPLQLGAEDMAFPVLNMLSFWTTAAALVVLLAAFFVEGGPPISGWTAYPPLSGLGRVTGPGEGLGQDLWIASLGLFCAASVMGSVNFIVTVIDMRAPEMGYFDMPLTCWSWFVTALISLFAFAVLLAAAILLLMDRNLGTSFFLPAGLVVNDQMQMRSGGSPILYQHLFWFFGHPEVYIGILPGMGLVSTVLSVFSRRPVFGYRAMAWAMVAIGGLGFLVWGHHMFLSGMSPYASIAFSVLTLAVGVPSAVKTFNWIATLWGGRIRFTAAMWFALAFVSLFISGGVTGLILGQPGLDLYFHDTYFVVAHFHLIMGVAAIFALFAGLHYWFPAMYGRYLGETLGKWHCALTFVGVQLVFIPLHLAGVAGTPRRYPDFKEYEFLQPLLPLQKGVTHAAYFLAAVQLLFLFNYFYSRYRGQVAPADPWEAGTREWAGE